MTPKPMAPIGSVTAADQTTPPATGRSSWKCAVPRANSPAKRRAPRQSDRNMKTGVTKIQSCGCGGIKTCHVNGAVAVRISSHHDSRHSFQISARKGECHCFSCLCAIRVGSLE